MQKNKGNAMVGVVIIILILLIGGYFLYKNNVQNRIEDKVENGNTNTDATTVTESATVDLGSVEKELDSLNLEDLDSGI